MGAGAIKKLLLVAGIIPVAISVASLASSEKNITTVPSSKGWLRPAFFLTLASWRVLFLSGETFI